MHHPHQDTGSHRPQDRHRKGWNSRVSGISLPGIVQGLKSV
nr:MAG TPA_asm: hypothetical protein [Caudoviricetes sp.]